MLIVRSKGYAHRRPIIDIALDGEPSTKFTLSFGEFDEDTFGFIFDQDTPEFLGEDNDEAFTALTAKYDWIKSHAIQIRAALQYVKSSSDITGFILEKIIFK